MGMKPRTKASGRYTVSLNRKSETFAASSPKLAAVAFLASQGYQGIDVVGGEFVAPNSATLRTLRRCKVEPAT